MIVIYVIAVVIGSLICAQLKAKIDEWLGDLRMDKQPRLSLRRKKCNNVQETHNDQVEISDDESVNLLPKVQKSIKKYVNVISHKEADVPSSMIHGSDCNSKHMHDISDDSSDEDVIIVDDIVNNSNAVFNKSQSLFNWDETSFAVNLFHKKIFPENNSSMPIEPSNKRQKLMNNRRISCDSSFSDDELMNLNSFKTDDSPPKVTIQYDTMIAGTNVKFPVKPYPCQIAVMGSLIRGCNKEQNCLLESPTGSGKTLALLCGALAWQEQYSEKTCQELAAKIDGESNGESLCCNSDDSLEELNGMVSHKTKKVPKIYYGTRTHRQIAQIIREFKKTAYRHKSMTILSSRKYTCIQETDRNKNDLCNELLDPLKGKKCPYYNEHSKKKAKIFDNMATPWDIEDLVMMGQNIGACPYYGARSLMPEADIIFCPYNYIVDPDIRESMQISLKNNIVILDEAHNIEDICRQIASVNLRDDELANAAKECKQLKYNNPNRAAIYIILDEYLTDIVKFLKNIEVTTEKKKNNFNNDVTSKTWYDMEIRVLLDVHNVGCSRFPAFLTASSAAIQDYKQNLKEDNPEKIVPAISQENKTVLERLIFAMQMIESDHVKDYRMYVVETFGPLKNVSKSFRTTSEGTICTMKLLCMNPAIIFAPLARTTRSVIVASGTLTPTTSFQGELGTEFPCIVNPNHIVPNDQIYVRCISRGPNNETLKAVYDTTQTWKFQDELGKLILQICNSVPYGVLCFFSSYKLIYTIHSRWKSNGIWTELESSKKIFVEPENNTELNKVMTEYHKIIEESSSQSFRARCGAILFAVYRGKVAEGIDFSDNEARCVIAVGVPYLFKNNDVDMKIQYNDNISKSIPKNTSKNLLSGTEWYTVNAFRAINQAIGRCVRHKNDWGAVLLVDERYISNSKFVNYLPKWVKTNIKGMYDNLEIGLQDFVAIQAARERGEKCVKNKPSILGDTF